MENTENKVTSILFHLPNENYFFNLPNLLKSEILLIEYLTIMENIKSAVNNISAKSLDFISAIYIIESNIVSMVESLDQRLKQ